MKDHIKVATFVTLALLSASGFAFTVSAQSSPRTFECKTVSGAPTTVIKDSKGERQMIRWTSDFGYKVGYTPQQRCEEVTNRMNTYFSQSGQFITHGVLNGEKVICITDSLGNDCLNLLYTLQPDQDPQTRLEDLFQVNNPNIQRAPIREKPCSTYVSVDALMAGKTRFAQEVCR